jgi:hypothetical protein
MDARSLSEADARYLDRVIEDCAEVLGPGVEIDDVELETELGVLLRLRYRLGEVTWSSEGHGATVTAAHAELRQQLVLDRIRMSAVAVYRIGR